MLVFDMEALMHHEFPRDMFLVEPILPMGGISMIHGQRGSFKTCLAITMGISIVKGEPFLGRYNTAKGSVVYVQLDMPYKLFQQQRIRPIQQMLTPEERHNFHFFLSDRPIDILSNRGDWQHKLNNINPALVIIDSLRKCHTMDENLSSAPTAVYSRWREIVGEGTTMVFLHHNRRAYNDQPDDFRGTGAWQDDNDMGLEMRKLGGKNAMMRFSRIRTAEDLDPIALELDPETMTMRYNESPEELLSRLKREGIAKADIIKAVTDVVRWKQPMAITTAYRRLENYNK